MATKTSESLAEKAPIPTYSLVKSQPKIQTKYKVQDLYLNKVETYINNAVERAKRIQFCVKESFSGVIMYGVDSLLRSSSNYPAVIKFIGELRAAGVTRVGVPYGSTSAGQRLVDFNNSPLHTSALTKLNGIISEIEPWVSSSGITWPSFIASLQTVHHAIETSIQKVETMSYQGWPQKPDGIDFGGNIRNTILNVDVPAFHCYVYGKPTFPYMKSRIIEVAKQAALLGHTAANPLPVATIYSAEPEFSLEYFKANPFHAAHDEIMKGFNATSFPYKACIDMSHGYLVFKESDARAARP